MLSATGTIRYDPRRSGKVDGNWWCIIDTNNGIADYYRWHVMKGTGIILSQPSWGAHVSVVRGEKPRPKFRNAWKKYDGKLIKFDYDPKVRYTGDTKETVNPNGTYWFLDVYCDDLMTIRRELGLKTFYKFHLTIGRLW